MDRSVNLATLPLADGSASGRKWTAETETREGAAPVRVIRHYGTEMMRIILGPDGRPIGTPREPLAAILSERPGGSMSDKCGLSRIRQAIIRHSHTG